MNNINQEKTNQVINTENVIDQLSKLTPSAQQRNTMAFRELYPAIQEALGRKIPLKKIQDLLAAEGMKMSMGGLRAQIKAEQERRTDANELTCCRQCGNTLPSNSVGTNSDSDPHD